MTTPLHSTLKRALIIDGREYVVTLTEAALKLTLKGKRNGVELPWAQLVNGEAALAVALHASLGAFAGKDKSPTAVRSPARNARTARTTPTAPTARTATARTAPPAQASAVKKAPRKSRSGPKK
jgi:hypothetical protein